MKEKHLAQIRAIDNFQSICAVVRSTPTHCAGVHTVCGEGAESHFVESVRVGKHQVCSVRKFVQIKKLKI